MLLSDTPPTLTAGRSPRAIIFFLALAVFLLTADLTLKYLAFEFVAGTPVHPTPQNLHDRNLIPPHEGVSVIPNVLMLKLTLNFGAVFGIGSGARTLFIIVSAMAVAVILSLFWRSSRRQHALHIALAMVLSGALGNLHDRIFIGAVRDMLYLFPGVQLPFGLAWPGGSREVYPWIFNIADMALMIGVGIILLTLLRKPKTRAES